MPRPAEVARHGRQERAGADHVAAGPLALEALPEPEERGASAVELGGLLDQSGRHARGCLAPRGSARFEQRLELLPADRVGADEALVDEPLAGDDVQEGEGECGVAAGERLEVEVGGRGRRGPHRVDDDHPRRRLRQPVVVGVRRRSRGIRAPHEDAGGVTRGRRVEADERRAVHVLERDVAGLVADRVGVDLRRSEPVEEAQREEVGEEREGSRVVRVQDRVGARLGLDPVEALGDLGERLVPGQGLEAAVALRPDPAQRARQPCLRVEEGAVVADRALAAEPAAAHRVAGSPRTWRIAPSRLTTRIPHAS